MRREDRPLERDVQKRIRRELKKRGATTKRLNYMGQRSAPDLLVIGPKGPLGIIFFAETKRLGEVPTPLQDHEHEDLRSRGAHVYVWDTYEQAISDYEEEVRMATTASLSDKGRAVHDSKRRGRAAMGPGTR